MKQFKQNLISMLLVLMVLALALSSALAVEIIDLERTGELSVTIKSSKTGETVSGGTLELFKVADIKIDNGYAFDNGTTDFAGFDLAIEEDADLTADLAEALAQYAEKRGLTGTELTVGDDGLAVAPDLSLGLYLVVQREAADGYSVINPFLVSIPQRGEDGSYVYTIDATPKPGTTVDQIPSETPDQPQPEKPAKPGLPQQGKPSEPKLPQTGQLWWPAVVLSGFGTVCVFIGLTLRKQSERAYRS